MSSPESSAPMDRAAQSSRIFAYLHRYRNLLRKHWWIPALTIALALAAQGWRLWRTPPTYLSYGRMVVNLRIANSAQTPMSAVNEEGMLFYGTAVATMQSSSVLNRAAERVRALHPQISTPAEPVVFQATQIPRTSMFHLTCTGLEPNYVRFYLDACMDEYLNLRRDMKESAMDTTLGGIQDKLARLQKDLSKGEEDILNFQSSNSVVSLEAMGGGASKELVAMHSQLSQLQIQYERINTLTLDQNLELSQNNVASSLGGIEDANSTERLAGGGAGYLQLKRMMELKKTKLKELAEYLRPKHPRVVALTEEMASQEKDLETLRKQSADRLENIRVTLKANIDILTNKISQLEINVADISRKMAQYENIKADIARNQQLYNQLLLSMNALSLGKAADPETVKISERASEAERVSLQLARNLILALFAGLVLGSLLLFVIDRLDDRPTSFTELQQMFDENVLGQVPNEKPLSKNAETRLLQPGDTRHAFVEAYRNLRSSLLYMATENKRAKLLLVTSAVPNDGKSMTTANLAITLAQSGSSVLLIDADLRRGQLHKRLSVADSKTGLTEVLTQNADCFQAIKPTNIPNLSLLPRGGLCNNPGEYFLRQSTKDLLTKLSAQYDYVVIDSAPVMAADDVSSLAPHIEGVIFVIRASQTSARIAHAALDVLYQREVNILGLVFNGVESAATEYYFYKYQNYAVYPGA